MNQRICRASENQPWMCYARVMSNDKMSKYFLSRFPTPAGSTIAARWTWLSTHLGALVHSCNPLHPRALHSIASFPRPDLRQESRKRQLPRNRNSQYRNISLDISSLLILRLLSIVHPSGAARNGILVAILGRKTVERYSRTLAHIPTTYRRRTSMGERMKLGPKLVQNLVETRVEQVAAEGRGAETGRVKQCRRCQRRPTGGSARMMRAVSSEPRYLSREG